MPFPSPSPSPHHSQRPSLPHPCQLPASLPPCLPRFQRAQIRSATCATLPSPLPRYSTLKVTATLVGRNPPPCRALPPQKPTAYAHLGLVIYPSRIPPTAASSNLFIRTLLLPCLALSCRAILLHLAAIRTSPGPAASISQYTVSHLPRPTQRAPSPILSLPLSLSPTSTSPCSTWIFLQAVLCRRAIDGTCQITGPNFIVETLFSDSLAAVHDSGAVV